MTVLDIEYFLSTYFSSIELPDYQIVCSHSFYFFRQTRKIKIFLDFGRMIWSEGVKKVLFMSLWEAYRIKVTTCGENFV